MSQYAYDAQIVLGGSGNLIRNVVKLLDSDTVIGGLKLNYNISELAPLGKSKMEICKHSFSPGMTIILDNYTDNNIRNTVFDTDIEECPLKRQFTS